MNLLKFGGTLKNLTLNIIYILVYDLIVASCFCRYYCLRFNETWIIKRKLIFKIRFNLLPSPPHFFWYASFIELIFIYFYFSILKLSKFMQKMIQIRKFQKKKSKKFYPGIISLIIFKPNSCFLTTHSKLFFFF